MKNMVEENNKYDIKRLEYLLSLLNDDSVTEEILLSLSNEIKELMGEDEKSSQ